MAVQRNTFKCALGGPFVLIRFVMSREILSSLQMIDAFSKAQAIVDIFNKQSMETTYPSSWLKGNIQEIQV